MAQVTKLLSASSVSARPSASTTLEVATDTGPRNLPSLISPRNRTGKRIRYVILEYDPLIDSSDVGLHSWKTIALDIERNYAKFDAFLVLHGTDVGLLVFPRVDGKQRLIGLATYLKSHRRWRILRQRCRSCWRILGRASSSRVLKFL